MTDLEKTGGLEKINDSLHDEWNVVSEFVSPAFEGSLELEQLHVRGIDPKAPCREPKGLDVSISRSLGTAISLGVQRCRSMEG